MSLVLMALYEEMSRSLGAGTAVRQTSQTRPFTLHVIKMFIIVQKAAQVWISSKSRREPKSMMLVEIA